MAEIDNLSVTDASNTARFPEGMLASTINNSARELEGILARWYKDTNASILSGGTGDAITVSANQTITAYTDGLLIAFDAANANTGVATLNVDGVGAAEIVKHGSITLAANDIKAGQKIIVIYDGINWQMISQLGNSPPPTLAYQSTWNAATNTPVIPAAAAVNEGHYYIVGTSGTTLIDGISDWKVNDWAISNGIAWQKIDNSIPSLVLFANQAMALTAGFGITGNVLPDAATVTPDFNVSNAFDWTVGANRTLNFPTIITGQTKGIMYIDATASAGVWAITLGPGLVEQGGDGLTIPSAETFRIWIVLKSSTVGHVYTEDLV